MAIKGLDLSRIELGLGLGIIEVIQGDPFATVISRTSVPVVETQQGNTDGYDVSSATGLRIYYDLMKGAATFVEIIFKVRASDPGGGGVPQPKGTGAGAADFLARVPIFDDVLQRVLPVQTALRLTVDERGCVTLPRFGQAFKVFVKSDNAAAVLAFAVQSVHAVGE